MAMLESVCGEMVDVVGEEEEEGGQRHEKEGKGLQMRDFLSSLSVVKKGKIMFHVSSFRVLESFILTLVLFLLRSHIFLSFWRMCNVCAERLAHRGFPFLAHLVFAFLPPPRTLSLQFPPF